MIQMLHGKSLHSLALVTSIGAWAEIVLLHYTKGPKLVGINSNGWCSSI